MKKNKKKVKISNYEKFLFAFTFVLLVFFPVLSVYAKSTLSKVNYEVEEKKEQIAIQSKSNQSLQMKINELASLENLEAVAKELGLTYSSSSVKTIE